MTKPKPIRPRDLRPRPVALAVNTAVVQLASARVAIIDDPLAEISEHDFKPVPAFATIASLAPKTSAAFVCAIGDVYIPRKDWDTLVRPGESIVFQVLPGKGGGGGSNPLRMILQLVLVVGVAWLVGPVLGLTGLAANLASAGLMIVGSLLINALVPLPKAQDAAAAAGASPTYSIALQGNSARMDASKPVGFGQQQQFPDFAMKPFQAFIANEQYYYAVFMIGLGRYEFQKIMIDDTPISNFADVDMHIVGPGNGSLYTQSLVPINMIGSSEVSGQELRDTSAWTGPFTACKPGQRITKIYADIVAPRGAGYANDDGSLAWRAIVFEAQAQEIDDFGNTIGDWFTCVNPATNANYFAAAPTSGAGTATAVQISCEYVMPDAKRYHFRMRRVTPYVDSTRDLCELSWVFMRALSTKPGIVEKNDPEGTYLLMRIRASKQLSGMSQRKISVVWERKIPYYDGSNWIWAHDGAHHRNPAWAIADMLRNPVYSIGLPMSRIDIASIMSLAAICAERQDRFDYIFDTRTTIWDALALAARCARAVNIVRRGNYSFVRDSAQSLPVSLYTPRNMSKDSLAIQNAMPQENTPDAVRLKYRDGRYWDERVVIGQYWNGKVYAYAEGLRPSGVPPPAIYADVPFPGISGVHQALREAAYIVGVSRWRRATYTFTTDLAGLIPSYGSLIGMAHDLPGFGQSAQVATYDAATRSLAASQPMTWVAGSQHYVRLVNRTGGLTEPIPVTKGATDDQMVLATAAGFTVVDFDDADSTIPTALCFGAADKQMAMLRLKGIKPKGENSIEMTAIIEDDRVHLADLPDLPVGGAAQDMYDYGNYQNAVMPATNALA